MTKVLYNGEEVELIDEYQKGEVELDTLDGFINDVKVAKETKLEDTLELPSINLEDTLELGAVKDE